MLFLNFQNKLKVILIMDYIFLEFAGLYICIAFTKNHFLCSKIAKTTLIYMYGFSMCSLRADYAFNRG